MNAILLCDANASISSDTIAICKLDFVHMIIAAVLIIILFVSLIYLLTTRAERYVIDLDLIDCSFLNRLACISSMFM